MFYLTEKPNLHVATPENWDTFLKLVSNQEVPTYDKYDDLMASLICGAESTHRICDAFNNDNAIESFVL